MAPALCPFGSLPHAPKHWLWPFGMCWSPAMQKTASIYLVPFALGVETRCYAGLERRFFLTCANERVWTSVKLRSHALKLKKNGPLDPLWALQCRKLGVDIFFWSSWGSRTSSLENVRDRRAWPTLINPAWWKKDTHANSCECPTITQTHVSSNTSPHDSNTQSPHLAQTEQVRLMRFFALPDSNTSPSEPNGHSAGAICNCDR